MSRATWTIFAAWYAAWCYGEWQRAARDLQDLCNFGALGSVLIAASEREEAAWTTLGLGDGRGDWYEQEIAA